MRKGVKKIPFFFFGKFHIFETVDINQRISTLISLLNSNPNSFADSIGVKSPVIYNIVKGRKSKPSYEIIQKILTVYNALNANWLLDGNGEIWKTEEEMSVEPKGNYALVSTRVEDLFSRLQIEFGEHHQLSELNELVQVVLKENYSQKKKISKLYQKNKRIVSMLEEKLGLNL
jgi:plasmid maintenance system antidote protein VapI